MKHQQYNHYNREELKVLIADDYPMERLGIKTILEEQLQVNIVGEIDFSLGIMELIQHQHCDLVLLDINEADNYRLEVIQDIKKKHPETAILAMGSSNEENTAVPLLRAGANGYFVKTSSNEELLRAINTITHGKPYISPDMEEQFTYPVDLEAEKLPHEHLSHRERQVMSLMSLGKTITEISNELALSVKTVSTYKTRIFDKLNISRNAHLIMYAFQHHLVN
jgi:two-component system invasion response regulator UvrY